MRELSIRDFDGISPLIEAVSMGETEIVELLLQYGADPEQKDDSGMTVRELAEKQGDAKMSALFQK